MRTFMKRLQISLLSLLTSNRDPKLRLLAKSRQNKKINTVKTAQFVVFQASLDTYETWAKIKKLLKIKNSLAKLWALQI